MFRAKELSNNQVTETALIQIHHQHPFSYIVCFHMDSICARPTFDLVLLCKGLPVRRGVRVSVLILIFVVGLLPDSWCFGTNSY